MFNVWGFGWVWVGLGRGSIISPGSGLGWVGSVIWWVGLCWVDENRPMDNSDLTQTNGDVRSVRGNVDYFTFIFIIFITSSVDPPQSLWIRARVPKNIHELTLS